MHTLPESPFDPWIAGRIDRAGTEIMGQTDQEGHLFPLKGLHAGLPDLFHRSVLFLKIDLPHQARKEGGFLSSHFGHSPWLSQLI